MDLAVEGVGDDQDKTIQDSLRIEWCKAQARSMRWVEEVELLHEEMRRVLQFLQWHAAWWHEKGCERTLGAAAENKDLVAYACRQAQLTHNLADHIDKMWMAHISTTTGSGRVHLGKRVREERATSCMMNEELYV